MNDSNMRLIRRKFEMEQRNALLGTMIGHFENMIADLDRQIATVEDRTRIKDTAHLAYSNFARAATKRRQKLLTSVAHVKSLLQVAERELDEVAMQSRDLESIQTRQPPPAPASKPEDISAAS
jgi:chromosome segregation ATPase